MSFLVNDLSVVHPEQSDDTWQILESNWWYVISASDRAGATEPHRRAKTIKNTSVRQTVALINETIHNTSTCCQLYLQNQQQRTNLQLKNSSQQMHHIHKDEKTH